MKTSFILWLMVGLVLLTHNFIACKRAVAQEPWEYRPYETQVWVSIDPTVRCSEETRNGVYRSVEELLDISFGAAVNVKVMDVLPELASKLRFEIDRFDVKGLQEEDLVLAVKSDAEELKTVRNFQAALEKLESFTISNRRIANFQKSAAASTEKTWNDFGAKLQGSDENLPAMIREGKIQSALISRGEFEGLKKVARQIPIRAPWQVEGTLRSLDKVLMVHIDQEGESLRIQVRELDSYLRFLGQVWVGYAQDWEMTPRNLSHLIVEAFTPMVRIEDTNNKLTSVRVRASRMVRSAPSPLLFETGDVLLPMMVRAEKGGSESTLEVIPWTYIAVADGDNVRKRCAIYSGINSGLSGKQNSRIQRLGLKVKTPYAGTGLRFVTQDEVPEPVAGVAAFLRTPGEQDLDPIGRSDWRGLLELPKKEAPEVKVALPLFGIRTIEMVAPEEREKFEKEMEASKVEDDRVRNERGEAAPATLPLAEAEPEPEGPTPEVPATPPPTDPATGEPTPEPVKQPAAEEEPEATQKVTPKSKFRLKVPLYFYFIKNGDTVLARLPIVLGATPMQTAEIPDDSRRLEAEAFLKGLQGEILDIIARRQILAIRIKKRLEQNKVDEAKKLLDELLSVKNYDRLAEEVAAVQRRILTNNREAIPPATMKKIDSMFDVTRQMMQKYMQDAFLREIEAKVLGVVKGDSANPDSDEPTDKSTSEQVEAAEKKAAAEGS